MNQPVPRRADQPALPIAAKFEPLRWIGSYKLVKGALALAGGLMVLRLLHYNLPELATYWLGRLGIDPASQFGAFVLKKVIALHARNLLWVAIALFGYTVLSAVEGIGLLMRRAWAEWLTVVTGGAMIPLEVWESIRRLTWIRVMIVLLNVAVVIYLVWRIRRDRHRLAIRKAALVDMESAATKQEGRRQQAEESH